MKLLTSLKFSSAYALLLLCNNEVKRESGDWDSLECRGFSGEDKMFPLEKWGEAK